MSSFVATGATSGWNGGAGLTSNAYGATSMQTTTTTTTTTSTHIKSATGVPNGGRYALGDISNAASHLPSNDGLAKGISATVCRPEPMTGVTSTTTTMMAGGEGAVAAAASAFSSIMSSSSSSSSTLSSTSSSRQLASLHRADLDATNEYAEEIFQTMLESERKRVCHPRYMNNQRDINASMRAILVDWLVEVTEEYKLDQETLYLTVNLIDRFLSLAQVYRSRLQLVGITAMLIASKFEEIYAPTVADFVYISDSTYTADEVLKMEQNILYTLGFELVTATANTFLKRLTKAARLSDQEIALMNYYVELTLQDINYLQFLPSTVAASAFCLALYTLGRESWVELTESLSKYRVVDLRDCMGELVHTLQSVAHSDLKAVLDKYSKETFHKAAEFVAPTMPLL